MKFLIVAWGMLILAGSCAPIHGTPAESHEYYPTYSDVPPAFYGGDPAMEQWYTFPYWNPEAGND
jgi:hypothetical protein